MTKPEVSNCSACPDRNYLPFAPAAAIRKYDPDYKVKLKQIVEIIDEKFAGRKFTLDSVNRHLEFDAVGYLRLLVRYQYLESIGKGEFERTGSWPPPARFFAGQPIGITYCVQTYWFTGWNRRIDVGGHHGPADRHRCL